jgi:hypothetical protein
MRKYRSFGETNLKYGIFSKANFERNEKKKSNGKFPINFFLSADFDRVGRGKGKQTYFSFWPQVSQMFTCGLSDLLLLAVGLLVVFVLREYISKVHILVSSEHKLCQI